jgi:hypothetical protein
MAMLRSLNELLKYKIHATDGDLGGVSDFYFDDQQWVTRYMVVDTGHWLPGRQVLISPVSISDVRWNDRHVIVNLTKEQVKNSPSVDTDKPVSRQMEERVLSYYAWPLYWENYGGPRLPQEVGASPSATQVTTADPALRSARQITGHRIHASDGEIGHIEDFLCDDQDWTIRYVVANTGNWIAGKKVVIAPIWIGWFDWANSRAYVDLTR